MSDALAAVRASLADRVGVLHGQGWEGVRQAVDSDDRWPLYLRGFAAQVSA